MAANLSLVSAQAAGFLSLMGRVEAVTFSQLALPAGAANIGGNGKGYRIPYEAAWDPRSTGNNDGTLTLFPLGADVYLYVVQQNNGVAKWIASLNSTYPDSYNPDNSRKIGGFHLGYYRGVENRYDTSYSPGTYGSVILPNSCWDQEHRPTCDPSGMVEVIPGGMWVDIYLNSEGSGIWPENVPVSARGATIIRDTSYRRSDFHQLLRNAGKRPPTVAEFQVYAEGAPAGLDDSNDQAWAATTNTGPTTAGGVTKAVSMHNVVDAVGNVWDWLDSHYDLGDYNGSVTPSAWDQAAVDGGKDSATPRGAVYHVRWRSFLGGGAWNDGVHAGARCLYTYAHPWHAGGSVGLRGVCGAA